MDNIIKINNLSFRYDNKFIYDNFNLSIKRGEFVTIAGSNGSGKTTLVKIIAGLLKTSSDIKIFDLSLNKKNLFKIRKEVGFVFDVPENFFACETVEDELAFSLENLAITPSVIKKKIKEVSKLLGIEDILKCYPYELSGGQKQKVAIACALMLEPRILVIDDSLMMIDINERKKILNILRDYNNKKKVTILFFTNTLEDILYSNRLIILNKGKIVLDGPYKEVFKEENILRKLGLEVPFEVEFTKKLMLYNLISSIELDINKVVDELWK